MEVIIIKIIKKLNRFGVVFCIIGSQILMGCASKNVIDVLEIEIQEDYLADNTDIVITILDTDEGSNNNQYVEGLLAESDVDEDEDEVLYTDLVISDDMFELPLQNSMGISYCNTSVMSEASSSSESLQSIASGDVFLIQEQVDDTWLRIITEDGVEGYVLQMETLINLPDVIPSICYNLTNSYSSLFVSSGYDIPNVTGLALYDYKEYNERLGYDEYIVTVLYPMAEKICAVQQTALEDNNTLVIYEAYRPYDVQQLVVKELGELAAANLIVSEGLTTSPWSMGWFIAQSISNHQKGLAIDTSLASITEYEVKSMNGVTYNEITEYEEFTMQTDMHELSAASISMISPVSSNTTLAWVGVELAECMTDGAILLREYCWSGGLEPLASEWWHFNDLETLANFTNTNTSQSLSFDKCISIAPDA